MRINMFWIVSWLAAAGIVSPAYAQSELVIDAFKESPYTAVLTNHPSWLTDYQTGPAIAGGVRQTNLTVSPAEPQFNERTRLRIQPGGSLVISGGYKSYFGLVLGYGYTAAGGLNHMDLDLSGDGNECLRCDRFRVDFDGSDSEMGYVMEVFDSDGHVGLLNATESLAGRILPFHVDFPFADFEADPAHPVDWHHIDFVFILFQTGTTLGGHDFAMTRIAAIEPPPDPVD